MASPNALPGLNNVLRTFRERAGFSQLELAECVGVSRQALIAIEAGRQVPSTSLSLQLARVLHCKVEDLFALDTAQKLVVTAAPSLGLQTGSQAKFEGRVTVGRVDGKLVAHMLDLETSSPADALVLPGTRVAEKVEVGLLTAERDLDANCLVAGCAPLLGLLTQRASARHDELRATWVPANNQTALKLLEQGLVHVAGVHTGATKNNLPRTALGKHLAEQKPMVINLTRWRLGLATSPDNPKRIRDASQLALDGLRIVQREAGSGADRLLRKLAKRYNLSAKALNAGPLVTRHSHVAQLVACGAADCGITIESCALVAGLTFLPITEERFDLVLPRERLENPAVSRLLDVLCDPTFRAEAASLPGYDSSLSGQAMGLTEA